MKKDPNYVSQIDAVLGEFTLSTCAINALGQGQYVVNGQHGERFLMSAVKDLSSNTRRQSASHVQELTSRV